MNGPLGEINLFVEVDDDRYAEPVQRIFKRIGEPMRVVAVDLDGTGPRAVRGLDATDGEVVVGAAYACAVEDSGSGVAWLVYGGSLGVWVGEGDGVPEPGASGAAFDAFLLVERGALVEG